MNWTDVLLEADLVLLQYTSGSTGIPRGCMVSQANMLACVTNQMRMILGAADAQGRCTVAIWLPLYHDMVSALHGRTSETRRRTGPDWRRHH